MKRISKREILNPTTKKAAIDKGIQDDHSVRG
jgi:hypothetical protein